MGSKKKKQNIVWQKTIPNGNSIKADRTKQAPQLEQKPALYKDERHVCINCYKYFTFSAKRQQSLYEEEKIEYLSRPLRCSKCKRNKQEVRVNKEKYKYMLHKNRSSEENLTLIEHYITRYEIGRLQPKQLKTNVGIALKCLPLTTSKYTGQKIIKPKKLQPRLNAIMHELEVIENKYKFLILNDFVNHPRYGHKPRYTPEKDNDFNNVDHQFAPHKGRLKGTAIKANTRKQIGQYKFTHYFDMRCICVDCKRNFIFFAEEQKHWYEELGFDTQVWCNRCVDCRRTKRGIEKIRNRYQELFQLDRSRFEHLELAQCAIKLIQKGDFTLKQIPHIRRLLKLATPKPAERESIKPAQLAKLDKTIEEVKIQIDDLTAKPKGTFCSYCNEYHDE